MKKRTFKVWVWKLAVTRRRTHFLPSFVIGDDAIEGVKRQSAYVPATLTLSPTRKKAKARS